MKPVKNFVFALLLVASLGLTTLAEGGDQNTPGYVPPPPVKVTSTDDGNIIPSDSNTELAGGVTADTSDYLLLEALAALLSVY